MILQPLNNILFSSHNFTIEIEVNYDRATTQLQIAASLEVSWKLWSSWEVRRRLAAPLRGWNILISGAKLNTSRRASSGVRQCLIRRIPPAREPSDRSSPVTNELLDYKDCRRSLSPHLTSVRPSPYTLRIYTYSPYPQPPLHHPQTLLCPLSQAVVVTAMQCKMQKKLIGIFQDLLDVDIQSSVSLYPVFYLVIIVILIPKATSH